MSEDAYKIAYEREKAARKVAENQLEDLTREVYQKNEALIAANQELRQNQQALVQQEKLASVGYLASGIAHEINNPLGYSLSNLTVLGEYADELSDLFRQLLALPDLPTAAREALTNDSISDLLEDLPDLISESSTGLTAVRDIVSDLRGFARTGEALDDDVDLKQCIETTLNVLKSEIRRHCHVELDLAPVPLISGNAGKINQVLANLLINAAHAMESGTLYVSCREDGGDVEIEISDDGPGVPEEHRAEVFSPFFTTKPVGEGTGLGLSIAYAIIHEDHHGEITLSHDGPGRGATFRIRLPKTA